VLDQKQDVVGRDILARRALSLGNPALL